MINIIITLFVHPSELVLTLVNSHSAAVDPLKELKLILTITFLGVVIIMLETVIKKIEIVCILVVFEACLVWVCDILVIESAVRSVGIPPSHLTLELRLTFAIRHPIILR